MQDPLTPYGNKPMVTPIVNAVNYHYASFDVLRRITDGEIDGYTYHRDDNPTVREVEKRIALMEKAEDCIVCTSGAGEQRRSGNTLRLETRQDDAEAGAGTCGQGMGGMENLHGV